MLFCSSKRARSSMTAVTSLPFSAAAQILHEPGLLGQAVDGDLDGEDRRVGGGLPDQAEEGLHAFKKGS